MRDLFHNIPQACPERVQRSRYPWLVGVIIMYCQRDKVLVFTCSRKYRRHSMTLVNFTP